MMAVRVFATVIALAPLLIGFGTARFRTKDDRIESVSVATPPPIVFSIVWTSVYLLLGILLARLLMPLLIANASFTSWQWGTIAVLIAHLLATFAWTPLYVSGKRRAALYNLLFVLATALILQSMLINQHQLFVVLLAPYVAWLIFAIHLNYEAVTTQQQ